MRLGVFHSRFKCFRYIVSKFYCKTPSLTHLSYYSLALNTKLSTSSIKWTFTEYLSDRPGTLSIQKCCINRAENPIVEIIPMDKCTKYVTPMLTHWSYVFLALTHRYGRKTYLQCEEHEAGTMASFYVILPILKTGYKFNSYRSIVKSCGVYTIWDIFDGHVYQGWEWNLESPNDVFHWSKKTEDRKFHPYSSTDVSINYCIIYREMPVQCIYIGHGYLIVRRNLIIKASITNHTKNTQAKLNA